MPPLNDRTGEKRINKCGSIIEIIEYKNNKDVLIKFLNTGDYLRTSYSQFNNANIKRSNDKFSKSVYGVGFFGEGIHKYGENRKMTHKYKTWHGMMRRCYDEKFKGRSSAYKNVTVAEVWHNFQNFGDWYDVNYYKIEGEIMHLDKDILVKGNKIYSPDTCIFVPGRINTIFTKNTQVSSKGLPPLTFYEHDRTNKKYVVRSHDEWIGSYNTVEEAIQAYKRYKEMVYKFAAYEYKGRIPIRLYEAMLNYAMEKAN